MLCVLLLKPIAVFHIFSGDRIVSVNGESITGRSYAEVVHLIQCSKDYLQLLVVARQDDILQMVSNTFYA